jgi:hypothetical protein
VEEGSAAGWVGEEVGYGCTAGWEREVDCLVEKGSAAG